KTSSPLGTKKIIGTSEMSHPQVIRKNNDLEFSGRNFSLQTYLTIKANKTGSASPKMIPGTMATPAIRNPQKAVIINAGIASLSPQRIVKNNRGLMRKSTQKP